MAIMSVNPNSGEVGGVQTGGDISSAVIAYFGEKANDAAQKTKAAIAKAKTDASINKGVDGARDEMDQSGTDFKVSTGGSLETYLKSQADAGNQTAKDLLQSMGDGTWTAAEGAAASALLNAGAQTAGVNDDAVNMALVQAAFQEFQTAVNGMSAVVKKSGDTKDSIASRMA